MINIPMKKSFLFVLLLCATTLFGQTEFSMVFYNLLNYPTAPPNNRDEILADILQEVQADIFMVSELESSAGSIEILNSSLNNGATVFESAPYQNNTSSGSDLQQLLYYNASLFNLIGTDIVATDVRDINRYTLQLLSENDDANPRFLEIFVTHLKSSDGAENRQIRLDMVRDFTEYLEDIDIAPNTNIIFAGDLNLYTSEEAAYQLLLNNTSTIFVDPIDTPGDWNTNSDFESIHTQSTRISNSGFGNYGAGGGLDSRFDFIMFSENILDPTNDISYIPGSYEAVGNNGNCFNNRLDSVDCEGTYAQSLRDMLYQMSDHLPIKARFQVNDDVLSTYEFEDIQALAWFVGSNIVSDNATLEIAFRPINSGVIMHTLNAKENTLPTSVSIFDQLGRHIYSLEVTGEKLQLPVAKLSSGLYFITLNNFAATPLKFIKT